MQQQIICGLLYSQPINIDAYGFFGIVLTAAKILAVPAPTITAAPVASLGTVAGSTKLALTPNNSSDTFKINVVSSVTTTPSVGDTPPGTSYTSGDNIIGVDLTTNKYIDIYEIDAGGKVVAFSEVSPTDTMTLASDLQIISTSIGSVSNSTKVSLNSSSNTFKYVIRSSALGSIPAVAGTTVPNGAVTYTSGNDITGVDPTTNKYLDIYEVNTSTQKIYRFKEIMLTTSKHKC